MSYVLVVVLSVLFRRSNGGWWNVKGARKTRIARCIGQRWQPCRQFVVASFVPFLFFFLYYSPVNFALSAQDKMMGQGDGIGWFEEDVVVITHVRRLHQTLFRLGQLLLVGVRYAEWNASAATVLSIILDSCFWLAYRRGKRSESEWRRMDCWRFLMHSILTSVSSWMRLVEFDGLSW